MTDWGQSHEDRWLCENGKPWAGRVQGAVTESLARPLPSSPWGLGCAWSSVLVFQDHAFVFPSGPLAPRPRFPQATPSAPTPRLLQPSSGTPPPAPSVSLGLPGFLRPPQATSCPTSGHLMHPPRLPQATPSLSLRLPHAPPPDPRRGPLRPAVVQCSRELWFGWSRWSGRGPCLSRFLFIKGTLVCSVHRCCFLLRGL